MSVYDDIRLERERAFKLHGEASIERLPADAPEWLAILTEEVGEVARALLESDSDPRLSSDLYAELIQVAAVASAWAEALGMDDA